MKSWLDFVEIKDTGRTKVWAVYNDADRSYLGNVKWHGPWRQYVFTNHVENTSLGSIWNSDCLIELAAFIKDRMQERK